MNGFNNPGSFHRLDMMDEWLNGAYDEDGDAALCDICGSELKWNPIEENWYCPDDGSVCVPESHRRRAARRRLSDGMPGELSPVQAMLHALLYPAGRPHARLRLREKYMPFYEERRKNAFSFFFYFLLSKKKERAL